jgi:2-polyprenyl-3-methyl-5-hydroxy-6-metoxy-1,4-benzoquinol methylase
MREFDDPKGTRPDDASLARRSQRSRRYLSKIARFLEKDPQYIRLLDVGCSTGAFLAVACKEGFAAAGVEPAPTAARSAQEAGLLVHQGLLEDIALPERSFDAVTLFEVVEHVREAAPLLQECHRLLRPGGVLVVGTGNTDSWSASFMKSRWEYLQIRRHGGHISFFNPRSIRILAERSGFHLESLQTSSVRFFEKGDVPYPVYRLAKILSELLNLPSRWLGKGHDLHAFLRRE